MAYNPNHISPPDNPDAIWCEVCGEQVFITDDDDASFFRRGAIVHKDEYCLEDYAKHLELEVIRLEKRIEELVRKDMS